MVRIHPAYTAAQWLSTRGAREGSIPEGWPARIKSSMILVDTRVPNNKKKQKQRKGKDINHAGN